MVEEETMAEDSGAMEEETLEEEEDIAEARGVEAMVAVVTMEEETKEVALAKVKEGVWEEEASIREEEDRAVPIWALQPT